MVGIDTLNAKLITYSRALKSIIPSSCQWVVIRDTDCVPCNKKKSAGNDDKKDMDTTANVKVLFQEGYGLESTFAADKQELSKLLVAYYEIDLANIEKIKTVIYEINTKFCNEVKDSTNSIHEEFKQHFNRQKKNRAGRTYDNLELKNVLLQITSDNIQYILTKGIMDKYLLAIHNRIKDNFPTLDKPALKCSTIFNFYYSWISENGGNILNCHRIILDEIYS